MAKVGTVGGYLRRGFVPSALCLCTVLLATPSARAESWRTLGARGNELAALVLTDDVERGFHRLAVVHADLNDGSLLSSQSLVPDSRYEALRSRGDYEILRREQELSRRQAMDALLAQGYVACEPAELHPLDREDCHEGETDARTVRVGRHGSRIVLRGTEKPTVLFSLGQSEQPALLVGSTSTFSLDRGSGDVLRFVPRRIRDLHWCGADARAVVLVESQDPPHAGVSARQQLVFGHKRAAYEAAFEEKP